MSSVIKKKTAMAYAWCVGIGILSISEISLALAYSRQLLPQIQKSRVTPLAHHKDLQHDISGHRVANDNFPRTNSRRAFIKAGAAAFLPLATAAATTTSRANAFENRKDDKYADVIPTPGPQPTDLGHSQRSNYVGLKECGNSPNCWNSSAPKANNLARWLPAWDSHGRSIDDVKRIMDTYEVGHDNIDGGGFQIVEYHSDPRNQYLYVQFQSYKAGYIDDFECWFNPDSKKFDVRSASRVGYSDLGVNALRLEYIANRLEKEYGWTFERRKNGKLV